MGEHEPALLVLAGLLGDLQRGQVAACPAGEADRAVPARRIGG